MQWGLFATLYALALPIFLALDFLWLGILAKNFYQSQLGGLLGEVNWVAAALLYAVLVFGVVYFAAYPAAIKNSVLFALLGGALFGFIAYATYDLTNLATLRNWPLMASVVDMIWGAIVCGLASGGAVFIRSVFTV